MEKITSNSKEYKIYHIEGKYKMFVFVFSVPLIGLHRMYGIRNRFHYSISQCVPEINRNYRKGRTFFCFATEYISSSSWNESPRYTSMFSK